MDFYQREENDGVRFSWNCVPRTKLQHQRNVIPLASMYTPLNNKSSIPVAPANDMVVCRQCRSFINPYVTMTEQQPDVWYCQFCQFANRLGQNQVAPSGLSPECSTIEYSTGRLSKFPPIFFYVVDTCFVDEDLEDAYKSLKESLVISLSLLPENSLVGFISFGKNVQIHDLSSEGIGKQHTFNGGKEYTLEQIQKSLGLLAAGLRLQSSHNSQHDPINELLGPIGRKFLQPVSMAEYQLTSIIENLVPNRFPYPVMKERASRSTGSALNIASLLLSAVLGDTGTTGGHIMCFVGGVCTFGPGRIASNQLKEPIRSHKDIEKAHQTLPSVPINGSNSKPDISLVKSAKKFYEKVTKLLVAMGLSCNIFIGSYDQIGLYEMDEVCYKTGGVVVMSDSFNTAIFKQSFIKFFNKQQEENSEYLDMAFNATLECRTTLDLQIQGLVGNATKLPYRKDNRYIEPIISKVSIGEGNTNTWKLCNTNPQSTYAIYFDKLDSQSIGFSYVQYLFHYQHPSGELRLRVTTVPVTVIADTDITNLELGFDQEASIVLIARESINKLQPIHENSDKSHYDPSDVLKHLDKLLIDYCTRYAVYTKGMLESFRLSAAFALLPQFMYYLRRSPFIRIFNNSPDETSFVRHVFMHEDVGNSLIMIQPTLLSYDVDNFGAIDEETGETNTEPEPVLLDSLSLGPSKVLLLDTFFHILIYHGSKVAQWRKAGYHTMEGYEHFKEFLEAPKREAMEILIDRFPLPRFIDCDEGGSQARFLMANLNPSTSYASNPNNMYGGQLDVLTDDTNLQLFMDHVQKVIILKK